MKRRPPSPPDLFGWKPGDRPRQVERVQLVDLDCLIRLEDRDTDKAFCVQKTAISAPVYLPRAVAELREGAFTIPRWLAIEKGLL